MKEIIKPGYKKTPVGIIPEDWEVKGLDSLFTFKNGLNADRTRYGKGVKFINVMEVIYSNSISPQDIPGTIEISEAQKKLYKVEYGDIVFNRTSETPEEVGLSAVYLGTEEVVFGGFVIRAKPRNKAINTLFKKYGFRSSPVRRQIIQRGQGAVRSNIGQKDLATVKIILPPLPEQKAIADCLSTWDRGIEKLTALIDAKKEQKKGLMQKLLTGSLRLRSATGEPFDGEWKEVIVNELADVYDGTHQTPNYVDEGIPFYSVEHLTADNFENTKFISNEVFQKENKRVKLEKGDVLMTRIGDIGTSKYVDWKVNASFYVTLVVFKKKIKEIEI